MGIFDDVSAGMKDAMRAKDSDRLRALRGIRAAFIEAMKLDNSTELDDDACLGLLKRLAKQRRESIAAYTSGGRAELAVGEAAELEVIEEFLPAGPDEATVRGWVAEAIAAVGATSPRELGRVMGAIMKAHRGEVDGGVARSIAAELLGGS